jgi:hypothetical protein
MQVVCRGLVYDSIVDKKEVNRLKFPILIKKSDAGFRVRHSFDIRGDYAPGDFLIKNRGEDRGTLRRWYT